MNRATKQFKKQPRGTKSLKQYAIDQAVNGNKTAINWVRRKGIKKYRGKPILV